MKAPILSNLWYNMCSKIEKTISDLILSHCSIFDWESMQGASAFQLDFLSFYADPLKVSLYWSPYEYDIVRDNPNWLTTDYDNVYKFIDWNMVMYQYVLPWVAPVSIFSWYQCKINWEWRWRVSIYGKALKLYYSWHLSWLRDYVIKYAWECCRADLCRDFKEKLNSWIIDLDCSSTIPDDASRTYKSFWKKKSPLFVRIYDKTLDLRRDKNKYAWLYPDWYMDKCWRLEFQFTWNYSRSVSAVDWLDWLERDQVISPIVQSDRNALKTALYWVINLVNRVNFDDAEKILVLENAKDLITKKIKALMKNKK